MTQPITPLNDLLKFFGLMCVGSALMVGLLLGVIAVHQHYLHQPTCTADMCYE